MDDVEAKDSGEGREGGGLGCFSLRVSEDELADAAAAAAADAAAAAARCCCCCCSLSTRASSCSATAVLFMLSDLRSHFSALLRSFEARNCCAFTTHFCSSDSSASIATRAREKEIARRERWRRGVDERRQADAILRGRSSVCVAALNCLSVSARGCVLTSLSSM